MEYAKGPQFAADFTKRTKDNLALLGNSPYDVTQLINSLIGLLIIPREYGYEFINDNLLDSKLRDAIFQKVLENDYPEGTTLKSVLTHMRNAVCHSRMKFHVDKAGTEAVSKDIKIIEFRDRKTKDGNTYQFHMEIPIELLREFVFAFSEAITNSIKTETERNR